ncbi:MAG TPA: FxLYD domain-containing protein [Chthonomonadaceae bacterium]|nr:FxLYD domain-containing protein [Chthonomonadaceae bacterium]
MSVPMRWEVNVAPEMPAVSPARRRRRARRVRPLRVAFVLCLGAVLCGMVAAGVRNVALGVAATPALRLISGAPAAGQVALTGATAERKLGFVTVTGNVTNRSPRALNRVEAVVELLNARNQTVRVESGLVAFDPLEKGETAPFRVDLMDTAGAAAYRVRFRQLLGPRLD